MTSNSALQARVEALRANTPHTRDLYKAVAKLLFIELDKVPTASMLYELVRKGSMQVPTEVMREFWAEMRTRAGVNLAMVQIPESLKGATVKAMEALWSEAQARAQESLEEERMKAQLDITTALEGRSVEEERTRLARRERDEMESRLEVSTSKQADLHTALEEERRAHAQTAGQSQQQGEAISALQAQLDLARQDFTSEIERIRRDAAAAIAAAEDRARAALLATDRARQAELAAASVLQQLRVASQATEDIRRKESIEAATTIATLRSELAAATRQATAAHQAATSIDAKVLLANENALIQRTRADTLQAALEQFKRAEVPKPKRQPQKPQSK